MVESRWKGYKRYDFTVNGRGGLVVVPPVPAKDSPWIWRAEFFDAFSQVDMAMLEKGWHLAYYKVNDMYGCPESIRLMNVFQNHAEREFRLSAKTVLFGFSRGGLYSVNYAAEYPDRVRALYLDAAVLDIRSWPGGMGRGDGAKAEWQECLNIYGLTEETAKAFKGNPLDRIPELIEAAIPVIVVAGDADTGAPYEENSGILVEKYRAAGGTIRVIIKPGAPHHPHSLEDPGPIVRFLLEQ